MPPSSVRLLTEVTTRKIYDHIEGPDEATLRALFHVYTKHGALDARRYF